MSWTSNKRFLRVILLNSKSSMRWNSWSYFITSELLPFTNWTLHPFLASDHFASVITVDIRRPLLQHKWNFKKAEWDLFHNSMEDYATNYPLDHKLATLQEDIIGPLHFRTDEYIPNIASGFQQHKNHWFYNCRIKELRHRISREIRHQHSSRTLEQPIGLSVINSRIFGQAHT